MSIGRFYILIRRKGVLTSPYVTIEISTSNFTNLIPVMRNIVECNRHSTDLGDVRMSLYDIYYLADEVFLEMRTYSIYARNCQHFCNRLLEKLGKPTFPMTFSSDIEHDDSLCLKFDLLSEVLPEISQDKEHISIRTVPSSSVRPKVINLSASNMIAQPPRLTERPKQGVCIAAASSRVVFKTEVSQLNRVTPGPNHRPTIDDLPDLLRILAPLEHRWEQIGHKLALQSCTLNTNQGLNKMLTKYLRDYIPSWEELANAVADFNRPAAKAVIKLANRTPQTMLV